MKSNDVIHPDRDASEIHNMARKEVLLVRTRARGYTRRHMIAGLFPITDVAGAIQRLEQVILSHCGEDAFDETLKLLLAKLHDEQRGTKLFRPAATRADTSAAIRCLFADAITAFAGLYPSSETIHLPDNVIYEAAQDLAGLALRGTALPVLDATLEHLLTRSAKGSMGQYFTPRNVVAMCVDILQPRAGEIVLDPACGSGGFLIGAIQSVQRAHGESIRAVGFDFDVKAFRVARIMAIAAGNGNIVLSRRNSLDPTAEDLDEGNSFDSAFGCIRDFAADVILTNPPFGGDVTDPAVLRHYKCRDSKHRTKMPREILFIERCVQLLKPGGRAAIVVPQGILANASLDFFREWLRKHCEILGTVSLHPYAFLPHTGVKTCVLFLGHLGNDGSERSNVFFAINTKPGKDSAGRFEAVDGASSYGHSDDLRQIAGRFRTFLGTDPISDPTDDGHGFVVRSVTVPRSEVMQNRRLDPEYYDSDVMRLSRQLERIGSVPLRSLTQPAGTWKRGNGGTIDYVDISAVDKSTGEALPTEIDVAEAPSRASYVAGLGDVLVSTVRPDRNTVGLITSVGDRKLVASNGFCVMRPTAVAPELLFAYCKTSTFRKLVTRAATATMYPTVADHDVLDVLMPFIGTEAEHDIIQTIRDAQEALREGRRLLAAAAQRMEAYVQIALDAEHTVPEASG
jgi:type I restriction enzyme M protein